jgi:hypothetical protein
LALALAGALSVSAAVATTMAQLNLKQIAKAAPVAVVGKVISASTINTDAGFVTVSKVKLDDVIWGTNADTVEVAVSGGSQVIGRYRVGTSDAGAPLLASNKEVVLMLTPDATTGKFAIVGFNQGVFPVVNTAEGKAVMLPGVNKLMPLNAAMSAIREARAADLGDGLHR